MRWNRNLMGPEEEVRMWSSSAVNFDEFASYTNFVSIEVQII